MESLKSLLLSVFYAKMELQRMMETSVQDLSVYCMWNSQKQELTLEQPRRQSS